MFESSTFGNSDIQIIDGDRGPNYPKKVELTESGYCLFLSATNVTPKGFSFESCEFISKDKDAVLRKGRVFRNDIVLTTRGTVGNVGFVDEFVPYEHIRINSGMLILRSNPAKHDPYFLYCYLRSESFQSRMTAVQSGAAQPQLPISTLVTLELPTPPIEAQREIGQTLRRFDSLIAINRRKIKILETTVRLLHKEWFIYFRAPGCMEPREAGVAEPESNVLPEGWRLRSLGELASEVRKSIKPEDFGQYEKYFGLEHLGRRTFTLGKGGVPSDAISSKLAFEPGDVLFGKIRPYFHKVAFAETRGICSGDTIILRARNEIDQDIVRLTAFSDQFVAEASAASKGTKMPRADWSVMKEYAVAYPNAEILDAFNSVARPISQLTHQLMKLNLRLESLRDLISPKLLSGEIHVSALNNETPKELDFQDDEKESERSRI